MARAGRVCAEPGCPALATDGNRCRVHRLQRMQAADAKRPSAARRGYDWQWQQISKRHRRLHPVCQCPSYGCDHEPGQCGAPSEHSDHVISLRHWPSRAAANQPGNLQALCARCHGRKTSVVDGSLGRSASAKVQRSG